MGDMLSIRQIRLGPGGPMGTPTGVGGISCQALGREAASPDFRFISGQECQDRG